MKKTLATKAAACIVALMLALTMTCAAPLAAFAATTSSTSIPGGMKAVTTTGNLEVTLPNNISTSITVSAYEMLQLVIPTGYDQPVTMTNDSNAKNVYVVTDNWINFFATAKSAYIAPLSDANTLYLTYDTTYNRLALSDTQPAGQVNENYIAVDNAPYSATAPTHIGKLDKTYFEADLISRITNSDPIAGETNASAARLLSDWASRYVKAETLTADASDTTPEGDTTKKYVLSDLLYGYYVIIATDNNDANGDYTTVNQSILNVPLAANVSLKATPVTVDKSVDNLADSNNRNNSADPATDNALKNNDLTKLNSADDTAVNADKVTASIGDILQYKVESHIPSLTSYDLVANSAKLLGIADADELTESNFLTMVGDDTTGHDVDKFVYVLKDKMINQDFIAADTTRSQVPVAGLKMEVYTADGTTVEKTYVVKELDFSGTKKYYIVSSASAASVTTANFADYAIGRLWETDYAQANSTYSDFFAINFVLPKLKSEEIDGRNVVFTYNAELMGEAGNYGNINSAQITYSNDPFDAKSKDYITTDNTNVYTYDLKLNKKFSDNATTEHYSKVKFKLFSDAQLQHSIKFVDNNTTKHGSYTREDSTDATTTDVLAINIDNGTLQLHGLGEGTYYLKEQDEGNALKDAGYSVVNTITVVVTAKNGAQIIDKTNIDLFDAAGSKTSSVTLDNIALDVVKLGTNNEYGIEFDVLNQKGFHLPLTGEYGNWLLAIGGILLVAVGGTVIILVNKRKNDISAA